MIKPMMGPAAPPAPARRQLMDSLTAAIPGANIYALLDGAMLPHLMPTLREWQPQAQCLCPELSKQPDLAAVAPWLARLVPPDDLEDAVEPFTDWVLEAFLTAKAGLLIFSASGTPIKDVVAQFSPLTTVTLPDQRSVYFRFYDPLIFATLAPSLGPEQLCRFTGVVLRYATVEPETGALSWFDPGPPSPPPLGVMGIRPDQWDLLQNGSKTP